MDTDYIAAFLLKIGKDKPFKAWMVGSARVKPFGVTSPNLPVIAATHWG